jgi:hypothetical protein
MYSKGEGAPQDYAIAYVWLSLASAEMSPGVSRDQCVRDRDRVAAQLTPNEIADAQKRAREWRPVAESH